MIKLANFLRRIFYDMVDGHSLWVSPLVKDYGDRRLCLDMRQVDEFIVREYHSLPTMETFLPKLDAGANTDAMSERYKLYVRSDYFRLNGQTP